MIDEKEMMKDDMVTKLSILLMENGEAETMTEALDTVINSETYQRMMDDKAALYYQSPRYVFDFLQNELTIGKVL